MKNIICTLARNEDVYINDWIKYHLGIGFSHIIIYDNGFVDDKPLSLSIDGSLMENVTIIDARYVQEIVVPNEFIYKDFLQNPIDYDWCAFIDIDEYIVLDGYKNINEFVSEIPSVYNAVALNWKVFGDDGVVIGNEQKPVAERILRPVEVYNRVYKTILKKRSGVFPMSPHLFGGEGIEYCDCNFSEISVGTSEIESDCQRPRRCYIKHYMTKTLSEFLKYKYPRFKIGSVKDDPFEYFFSVNEKTPDKVKYIKDELNIAVR